MRIDTQWFRVLAQFTDNNRHSTRNRQREQACSAPKSSVTSSTAGLSLAVNKVEFERKIKASFAQNWKKELLI